MRNQLIERLEAVACAVTDLDADDAFATRATELLARLHPQTARELGVALAVIDHPIAGLFWGPRVDAIRRLSRDESAERIRRMMSSRIPAVRAMASACRSAAAALLWSDPSLAGSLATRE